MRTEFNVHDQKWVIIPDNDDEEDDEEDDDCPSCGEDDCGTCDDCEEPRCDCRCCEVCEGIGECNCCFDCGTHPCECCDECGYHQDECVCDAVEEDPRDIVYDPDIHNVLHPEVIENGDVIGCQIDKYKFYFRFNCPCDFCADYRVQHMSIHTALDIALSVPYGAKPASAQLANAATEGVLTMALKVTRTELIKLIEARLAAPLQAAETNAKVQQEEAIKKAERDVEHYESEMKRMQANIDSAKNLVEVARKQPLDKFMRLDEQTRWAMNYLKLLQVSEDSTVDVSTSSELASWLAL
jgi:hypothetical protein